MELNLKGKTALVTGGSRGLGKGLCQALASEGVNVVVNCASTIDKAQAVAGEIASDHGVKTFAIQADVTEESDVQGMFDAAEEKIAPVDILVNNAGICPVSFIKDMPVEMWRRTIEINLTGTFLMSREMVRRLTAAKRPGRIISISSQAAFSGSSTGKGHYAASKAGMVALTVSLAKEVAHDGITVNTVAPGMMLTEMTAETLEKNAERYRKQIPLGRVAEISEVADVVLFLASDRGAYVTGATYDVTGGMLMR